MERVQIVLHTPLEGFANEYADVLKLFYKLEGFEVNPAELPVEPPVNGGAGGVHTFAAAPDPVTGLTPETLSHTHEETESVMRSVFTFRGVAHSLEAPLPPAEEDQEHYTIVLKRIRKRTSKTALYRLLKKLTGHQPPWGSLTGIRPTRLVYEGLARGLTLPEAARAVEDSFDVTHEKAELLRQIVAVQQTLPLPTVREADVYLSIPFCRTRCAYCSFPGEAVGKGKMIPPYLDALLWEMEESAKMMREAGLTLRALYVGGGTPSALDEAQFARLMERTMELFPGAVEYTVEAGRPDTITRGKLETLHRLGVGRISINPQTMNDETLRVIGRDHTAAQTVAAFEMAREIGFSDINMDVIVGLPGETPAHFRHTMDEILRLSPDSLTVHTLAIKRSSRLNLEKAPLPDADVAAQMVRMGEETAQTLGMLPYYLYRQKYMAGQQQNVGYARKGCACLYNIDIMEENTSIVAMGAGAISKRVFPDRELRIERAPNVTNVQVYIDRVDEMMQRKKTLFLG
ncbi:MAG: coproporphyrinogen dehydrogenase HemZ [Clostridia bacterium]|nr:coproporphyrinogen dehydrogenase HemZ [Clostridia bacterium]